MGWNSWDAYGLTITEDQFRANVKVLSEQLKQFGWTYAVIDEGWFLKNPEDRPHPEKLIYTIDANGRYVPVPARFPSAGKEDAPPFAADPSYKLGALAEDTSFKALGDYVHSQGLKFGIHIVRGIPRASVERNLPIADSAFHATDAADTSDACPWDPTNWGIKDNPAGQAWYDSLLTQYASWGVDILKVDCISDHPYKSSEIRQIRRAIDKTGRPIVLSLSPGPTSIDHAAEVTELANMWRISNDIWDYWTNPKPFPRSVSSQFETTAAWAQSAGPGHWPDADMLPLGELRPAPGDGEPRTTRLTLPEQKTMLTLWAIARSPLILGANLTLLDDTTLKLLANRDLIQIDQTATASRQVLQSGGVIAWTADLPDGTTALAIFNTGESQTLLNSSFEAYNLPTDTYRVRDVWAGKTFAKIKSIQALTIEPHACVLWILRK
jgi:alpha-galactosidase